MPYPAPPTAEVAPAQPVAAATRWWVRHYTFTGTATGLVFIWLSMTPSLLPRGPLYQGLVTGCCGAIGYGLGVFTVWLVRYMRSKDSSPSAPRWAWVALIAVGAVGHGLMISWVHVWQNQLRDLIEVPRLAWYNYPQGGLLAIVVLFVLVELGQLIRRLIRFLVLQLDRVAPPRVSAVVVVLLLATLAGAVLNGVVANRAMRVLNNTFAAVNEQIDPDNLRPSTPLRSGGPHSLVPWMSLGHQGRIFVSSGPTVAQLTAFNRAPATQPIRAYAGLDSVTGIRPTAELAALELQRTGAFDRAVVAVATTTGTGWLNEAEASALEYMYNGNTAIVSMQYSFLPSWLSFLVDKENARHAGQA
ncbi:MAG TPA: alpha/beta-hydrolase N-terminal domain-containing protein, partial [Mycobacterium sp.]